MNELFGFTRDVVKERYALRTSRGFVPSCLPGWSNAVCVVQISPAMGAKFTQLLVTLNPNGEGRGNSPLVENFVYVLAGDCSAKVGGKKHTLKTGGYIFIPAQSDFLFDGAKSGAQLLIFQKRFEALSGAKNRSRSSSDVRPMSSAQPQ